MFYQGQSRKLILNQVVQKMNYYYDQMWKRFPQLFKGKVLLVRPDGHIAARFESSSAARELVDVVSALFPRAQASLS